MRIYKDRKLTRKCMNMTAVLLLLMYFIPLSAFSQDKRPLSIEDFAQWKSIGRQMITDDAQWISYTLTPNYGSGELTARNLENDREWTVARGDRQKFAADNTKLIFIIVPPADGNNEEGDSVRQKLGIMDLDTGNIREIEGIESFLVSEDGNWLGYQYIRETGEREPSGTDAPESEQPSGENKNVGSPVILINLATGQTRRFEDVDLYQFNESSTYFLYSVASAENSRDGLYAADLNSEQDFTLLDGPGKYRHLTWNESAEKLAFVSNRDDYDAKDTFWKIYTWNAGSDEAEAAVDRGTARNFPGEMRIAENPGLRWSKNAATLFFNIGKLPEAENDSVNRDDLPDVDIWHWKDVLIQTQQHTRLEQLRNVTYLTAYQFNTRIVVPLADEEIRSVDVAPNFVLGVGGDVRKYEYIQPWNPTWQDVYLIDIGNGSRSLIKEKHRGDMRWSSTGRYLYWFEDKDWYFYSIESGEIINLTEGIDVELRDTLNDRPTILGPWGSAGWTRDDEALLVYDQYDIWLVPVEGGVPENMTGGEGRRRNAAFRYVRLDAEEEYIDLDNPLFLSYFDNRTKARGYYRLRNGTKNPVRLVELPKNIGRPVKARNADAFLFTLESFEEFPDLHVSDMSFRNIIKVSYANPQQDDFLWGTEQLVEWKSADGKPLQGVLYLPENYEEGARYPLILYIYERMSQRLHTHSPPIANHRFNATEYTSQGYAVLYPDIVYDKGLPGPSSVKCLVPAVQKVIEMGIADPARVGLQGHSWGGYESAYIITQTDIFAAVCSGAPVSNMTSAYGGIRWGSGNPRTFQYETGQSRIGGSLWEYPELYIENSPLFFADRVNTPLLIMHGDNDDAVPWYQAIEYFLALRRLNKPVWFLQYNDEPHHLQKKKNKYDFTVRMFEFFEHYLKDKPMPQWMQEGVPATEKGRE
ncbi:prolyl oligopeptidase family serine peptidase [candidate division KSB1 bacterium]